MGARRESCRRPHRRIRHDRVSFVATALCCRAEANAMNASTERGGYSITRVLRALRFVGLAVSKNL